MMNLTAARFRLELVALEGMNLPPYKGSTFRGGFGGVFRRIACSRRLKSCNGCLLKNTCPYGFIFEPGAPEGAEVWGKFEEIPRPFVIEPPETAQTYFTPGEGLCFHLVLTGKAIDYLPYFILVFKELGGAGIGKGRARYKLNRVLSLPTGSGGGETVYDGVRVVSNRVAVIRPADLAGKGDCDGEELRLVFKTMTRLKTGGAFVDLPEFPVLVRALLRRLSALQYFYCGERLECDFNGLIARAGAVRLTDNQTFWADWERYSSRQDIRMHMGGLVGEAGYEGPWQEFEELLRWGEVLHVGKGATFGLGKYRIKRTLTP
ncbi:MAG: CRISPR system precrRNA processing endoribonuclease RAMP protein Cas6 [Firmicutes bacterium]|nr:CRISPR system precrRNA processing endoribonuclease RAMP protein Cas6 [Bacillota bacterium]